MTPSPTEQGEGRVTELTAIVRRADEAHQKEGGGTRHWVRYCFLPELEAAGWTLTRSPEA